MTKPGLSLAERFWLKVDKSGDCWLWCGYVSPTGYGEFNITAVQHVRVHRMAYELTYGPIPEGVWVLHRCDNRRCVNPTHLYLGDRADNMRDAHQRGRIDLRAVASAPRPGARKAG